MATPTTLLKWRWAYTGDYSRAWHVHYDRRFCTPTWAGWLAEVWQQRGPGSAAACDKTAEERPGSPPYWLCTHEQQIHMFQRLALKEQTSWPSVSERLNLVVIDLGHPPGTQISERAVILTIQLQPSVARCHTSSPSDCVKSMLRCLGRRVIFLYWPPALP